jgi:carbamoyltransferase
VSRYVLSVNPGGLELYPHKIHNSSAVLFEDEQVAFGVEEERFSRDKHGSFAFPEAAIEACLDACNVTLGDIDTIVLPWDMTLKSKLLAYDLNEAVKRPGSLFGRLFNLERTVEKHLISKFFATNVVRNRLAQIDTPVPPVKTRPHHLCHAASAFYPSPFQEALVVTIDGFGEYDSTVVWTGTSDGVDRQRTYEYPNSLGEFYKSATVFLGYTAESHSEGKIMGLAPYGEYNDDIVQSLETVIDTGVNYDVKEITKHGIEYGARAFEELFDRDRKETPSDFTDWEQDFAYAVQYILEEVVTSIVRNYLDEYALNQVCLAGGVALNCKMNKRIMELDPVDEIFIQPVAHDGGLAVGAGMLEYEPESVPEMKSVYWGPSHDTDEIRRFLEQNKIDYSEPTDIERTVAERLSQGAIVGWFQGRLEMGPRALGNRSILADPRTAESRDRVNEFVKHREDWRPFAPSMLAEAATKYLVNPEPSPYMIKTFDTVPEHRSEIEAVLHPGDKTTRPQTVTEDENPRYYRLISEFEGITGTPVILNTSFNDHGEPIVNTPREAVRDLYSTGIDTLVLGDILVEK